MLAELCYKLCACLYAGLLQGVCPDHPERSLGSRYVAVLLSLFTQVIPAILFNSLNALFAVCQNS